MFPGTSGMESANFLCRGRRDVRAFAENNKYLTYLLGSWVFFERLYTWPTVKASKHMVKLWQRVPIAFAKIGEI